MEYERNFQTSGEQAGQDITFLFFEKNESRHEQHFLELAEAINIFVDSSLEVQPYSAGDGHCWIVNKYLTEPEIYELTDGCPSIRFIKTRHTGSGVSVSSQYL